MDDIHNFISKFGTMIDHVDDLVTGSRIWRQRTEGVGVISAEDALNYGCRLLKRINIKSVTYILFFVLY